MNWSSNVGLSLGAAAAGLSALAPVAPAGAAEIASYYVGVDDMPAFTSGAYSGLPNPNYNRLTILYAHPSTESPASSHYHSKATRIYTGPNLGASTAQAWSASDYLPEGTIPPVRLATGTGVYAGKLASAPYADPDDPGYHFSFFEVRSTQSLATAAAGTPAQYLFNSSGGRWDAAMAGADVHLVLVSLTPGLNVGTPTALTSGLNGPGDELHLGEPDASMSFTPTFWTDGAAAPGVYEAKFRLVDEGGAFGDSGEFRVLVSVPEPGALAGIGLAGATLMTRRVRRRSAGRA
ncbi:MAG TPA: all3515 family Zur-repressed PEP-CTERM protein [Tepidisphaeraceae bacterium]|nr:all3515 family Zur-repressed PEP-CTERM protein [Tepidisphaeraceae bacterium]